MDLLVSLSALVKVDRVPENIRLTISHSWKYGSSMYLSWFLEKYLGTLRVLTCVQLLAKEQKSKFQHWEPRIVVFLTLYCRACGAETANSKGSEKKEISFVKEGRQREKKEERKKEENYEQDQ